MNKRNREKLMVVYRILAVLLVIGLILGIIFGSPGLF